jgi:hypothetical protein
MNVELYGYQYSVYSWIARLALEEKGASYHWIEILGNDRPGPISMLLKDTYWRKHEEGWHRTPVRPLGAEASK